MPRKVSTATICVECRPTSFLLKIGWFLSPDQICCRLVAIRKHCPASCLMIWITGMIACITLSEIETSWNPTSEEKRPHSTQSIQMGIAWKDEVRSQCQQNDTKHNHDQNSSSFLLITSCVNLNNLFRIKARQTPWFLVTW
jgi:hypothetical protein